MFNNNDIDTYFLEFLSIPDIIRYSNIYRKKQKVFLWFPNIITNVRYVLIILINIQ